MNLFLVLWLWLFCPRRVWVMFHEVAFPLSRWQSWKSNLLGVVQRVMAAIALKSAERIFVTIPGWLPILRRLHHPFPPVEWLPVGSNLPEPPGFADGNPVRRQLPAASVVGHFGTYGNSVVGLLEPVVARLLRDPNVMVLFLGRGSSAFESRFLDSHSEFVGRTRSADDLAPEEVAIHLTACDLLLQPYPDGLSTRRTTVMAGLRLGVPVVSNRGELSESIWTDADCVELAPTDPTVMSDRVLALLRNAQRLRKLAANGRRLYHSRFSFEVIAATLRARFDE